MNLPAFLGGADPVVAKNWMQEIEKILMVLNCTNEHRVLYASYKLTGEAERWWTVMRLLEEQRQYAKKFIELSRFTPYSVPDEVEKARIFERGLRWDTYKQVVVSKLQYVSEMVDRATMAEESE
ncbi:uncharacterized protein LOC131160830 [Malania oleifera]|uniref:uncharacterized protein LOC131160830 n=1 Tax=Malania oleifera TaxID=397392 RepID=UPI0025ADB0DF|nr:uncharacterized protein LOC131160830 [Malania oleifera]